MEKDAVSQKNTEQPKKERHTEKLNKVILVQVAVCAFFILLVFAAGKLSPSAFEFLKAEYDKIMSVDMSAKELLSSRKKETENTPEPASADFSEPAVNDSSSEGEGGEDSETADTTVAVMSVPGKNGQIVTPLRGRITSRYGYRTNPISGKYGLHTGVDIAADEGSSIVAAYNGVVKETGYGEKKGNYVLMEHTDGTQTLYCHCSELLADEGAVIRAGEVIALVGSTGWSTGPHLHFEIRIDGKTVDPLTYIEEDDGEV